MPNAEWGVKRVCPTTGKRFYDMNRSPVVSPYSGEVVEIDEIKRHTPGHEAPARPRKAPVDTNENEDDELLVDDADTTVDVDDDLLEDDDDSVAFDDLADVASEDDNN